MSEDIRDLSEYGISMNDQHEWLEVRDKSREIPPYPEALKDMARPVIILNAAEEYVKEHHKRLVRMLVGKIDGVFLPGVYTEEKIQARKDFHTAFDADASFEGRTFVFGRTKILHLPEEQYQLTLEPTEWTDGKMRVSDTAVDEVIDLFDVGEIEEDTEIVVIPPYRADIDEYAAAVKRKFAKVPHVAFWTVTRFADSVNWRVAEYRPGMPNLFGMEDGAL